MKHYVAHKTEEVVFGPYDDFEQALKKYLELDSDDYAIFIEPVIKEE